MRNVNVFLTKNSTYAQSHKIEINKILKDNFFAVRMSKLLKGA